MTASVDAKSQFYESIDVVWGVARTPRLVKTLQILSQYRARRILDLGCGAGDICVEIGKLTGARELYGADISQRAVDMAKTKGITAIRVDLDNENLPFESKSFDIILALEIIEHLVDPDHLLLEMKSLLNPGGKVVVSTPNLAWWLNRIALGLGFQPFFTEISTLNAGVGKKNSTRSPPVGHLRVFTNHGFKELALLHGFRITGEFPSPAGLPGRIIRGLDSLLSMNPHWAANVIYVCERGDQT